MEQQDEQMIAELRKEVHYEDLALMPHKYVCELIYEQMIWSD